MSKAFEGSQNVRVEHSNINLNTIYNQTHGRTGFDILTKAVSPHAFHNSDDRPDPPKCHENTRVAVINAIIDWVLGEIDTEALILWLYGPAGAGKTAIARSVAELCEAAKLLLASFFFFRTDPSRNSTKSLAANAAYSASLVIPASRGHIARIVETNPLIFDSSLEIQLTKLLLEPLQHLHQQGHFSDTPFPPLVIIDGLDECVDENAQSTLLEFLSSAVVRHNLPIKFLIASRPEQQIKFAFNTVKPQSMISQILLNDDFHPDQDIHRFLGDRFRKIKECHPFRSLIQSSWPDERQLRSLVQRASGQFIYASLVARFANSPHHFPPQRLDIVLDLRSPDRDLPFAELDLLYKFLLSRVDDVRLVLKIMSIRIALETEYVCHLDAIEAILGLEPGSATIALGDLTSILECDITSGRITFHHSSFIDFLLSKGRSDQYHIDKRDNHSTVLQWILQALGTRELPKAVPPNRGAAISCRSAPEKKAANTGVDGHIKNDSKRVTLQSAFRNDIPRSAPMFIYLCNDVCIENGPSPEKFDLMSTVWFVLQTPLRSCVARQQLYEARGGPDPSPVWKRLCTLLFGFESTAITWDDVYYQLLDFPTEYNRRREHYATNRPLSVFFGDIRETERVVSGIFLSNRVARVAISCIVYLRYNGFRTTRQTHHVLRVWALKSTRLPWLSRRRMRRPGLLSHESRKFQPLPQSRLLRRVFRRKFITSERKHTTAYLMYLWTLDLLHRVLLVAKRSMELASALSRPLALYPAPLLFPRRIKRVKQVVEQYLKKYGQLSFVKLQQELSIIPSEEDSLHSSYIALSPKASKGSIAYGKRKAGSSSSPLVNSSCTNATPSVTLTPSSGTSASLTAGPSSSVALPRMIIASTPPAAGPSGSSASNTAKRPVSDDSTSSRPQQRLRYTL